MNLREEEGGEEEKVVDGGCGRVVIYTFEDHVVCATITVALDEAMEGKEDEATCERKAWTQFVLPVIANRDPAKAWIQYGRMWQRIPWAKRPFKQEDEPQPVLAAGADIFSPPALGGRAVKAWEEQLENLRRREDGEVSVKWWDISERKSKEAKAKSTERVVAANEYRIACSKVLRERKLYAAPYYKSYGGERKARFVMTLDPDLAPTRALGGGVVAASKRSRKKATRPLLGVAMPSSGPERSALSERKHDRAQDPRKRGYDYVVLRRTDNPLDLPYEVQADAPATAQDLIGVVFDLAGNVVKEFRRLLSNNQLCLDGGKVGEIVEMDLVWGGDGITPEKESVLGLGFKIVDRRRKVILPGGTNTIPAIVVWGSEKWCQSAAPLLNLVLAEFCLHVYTFDTDLALRFTPRKTYGDGKFSFLSAGLSGGQSARRCFICKANIGDTAKGLDFSTEYRDYADMTRTYATALFVVVKTVHANKDFKITKARKLLRLLAGAEGAHNFPWVVSGNTQAKEEIMLLLTSFLWPDCENPQEQLAAERAVVQARLDEMLHLDARLNESPLVVYPNKLPPSMILALSVPLCA